MVGIKVFACFCIIYSNSVNGFSAKLSRSFSSRSIWTTTSRKIRHHDSSIVKLGAVMQGVPQQNENNNKGGNNEPINNKVPKKTFEEKMQQISNVASMLCVVDCTVLPIVTVLLPLFGVAATSSSATLHEIGHAISLYFVLPVGSLTATLNYLSSKQKALGRKKRAQAMGLFFMSLWGLFLVYVANSHSILRPIMFVLSKALPHKQLHALHSHTSILHKATNVLGCGLLMSSNSLSHRIFGCNHHHHHGDECQNKK